MDTVTMGSGRDALPHTSVKLEFERFPTKYTSWDTDLFRFFARVTLFLERVGSVVILVSVYRPSLTDRSK